METKWCSVHSCIHTHVARTPSGHYPTAIPSPSIYTSRYSVSSSLPHGLHFRILYFSMKTWPQWISSISQFAARGRCFLAKMPWLSTLSEHMQNVRMCKGKYSVEKTHILVNIYPCMANCCHEPMSLSFQFSCLIIQSSGLRLAKNYNWVFQLQAPCCRFYWAPAGHS